MDPVRFPDMTGPRRRKTPEEERSAELFSRNIRNFREETHLSRDEAADRIGISSKYLYMLENSERPIPSHRVLKKLARAYGRRVDDLDAADPPPADETLYPIIKFGILLHGEEARLLAADIGWAIREFEKIEARLAKRLAEERAKLRAAEADKTATKSR